MAKSKKVPLIAPCDTAMLEQALNLLEEKYRGIYPKGEEACLAMALTDVEILRNKLKFITETVKVTMDQRLEIYKG